MKDRQMKDWPMTIKRSTLANALRVAADVYTSDATSFAALPRARHQFANQAQVALSLADRIERADTIHLED